MGFSLALPERRTSVAVRLLLFARANGISQFWSQQGAGLFGDGRVLRYSPKTKRAVTPLRTKELFRLHARTIKDKAQNAALCVKLFYVVCNKYRKLREAEGHDAPKRIWGSKTQITNKPSPTTLESRETARKVRTSSRFKSSALSWRSTLNVLQNRGRESRELNKNR